MFDAVLLDFYGTVVHEDDVLIDQICSLISRSIDERATPSEVGAHWWRVFSDRCTESHGEGFEPQRVIELRSLEATLSHVGSDIAPGPLAEMLFQHWQRPPIFADAAEFLRTVDRPIVIASNIDRFDVEAAIDLHRLSFSEVITSEDVRSYKPRPEMFAAGLEALQLPPERVVHIGDSLTSDVAGAEANGIASIWVNRAGRTRPDDLAPTFEVVNMEKAIPLLRG